MEKNDKKKTKTRNSTETCERRIQDMENEDTSQILGIQHIKENRENKYVKFSTHAVQYYKLNCL